MAKNITWHTETRKVDDLVPYDKNPRTLLEKQRKDLEASITKFSLAEIPVINTDNTIMAGHTRLKVIQLLGRGQEEIHVRVLHKFTYIWHSRSSSGVLIHILYIPPRVY